ncbi:UrcA family protein [Phenylobacterium sp.]|uniref:UrcA family protein n=1 Tax=Phenylobacterium sp. TaxID=1871053 RepID=UPI002FCA7F88
MFKSTLAGVATLALAIIPVAALATAAHAAPVTIRAADIDTLSPEGVQAFHQRAEAAARKFCRAETLNQRSLVANARCMEAVRVEISEKFAARNTALAAQRQANTLASR